LRTFKHYWQALSASIKRALNTPASTSPEPGDSVRDAAAISSASHMLAANLKRTHHQMDSARDREHQQYDVLAQRLGAVETGHDRARELTLQLQASLAAVSTRLAATEMQLKALHAETLEQATEFRAALLENASALQAAVAHVEKLAAEHRLHESVLQEVQAQLRRQDRRLVFAMRVAAVVLLLAIVAAAVLIWEAQKNVTLLNSMSADLKQLMSVVEQGPGMPQQSLQATQQAVVEPVTTAADITVVTSTTTAAVDVPGQGAAGELDGKAVADAGFSDSRDAHDAVADPEVSRQTFPHNKRAFFIEGISSEEEITLPGGVHYQVVQPGRGRSPALTDRVAVDYLGITRDGRVFDDTYSLGQPAEFYIYELAPAWQETLLSMQEGAQWEVSVPPGLVLVNSESGGGMPGNKSGTYLIELLEILE
jgi:FKBP-type peptidyl-prolyl cis-trans isomerase/cell division protein FtsL